MSGSSKRLLWYCYQEAVREPRLSPLQLSSACEGSPGYRLTGFIATRISPRCPRGYIQDRVWLNLVFEVRSGKAYERVSGNQWQEINVHVLSLRNQNREQNKPQNKPLMRAHLLGTTLTGRLRQTSSVQRLLETLAEKQNATNFLHRLGSNSSNPQQTATQSVGPSLTPYHVHSANGGDENSSEKMATKVVDSPTATKVAVGVSHAHTKDASGTLIGQRFTQSLVVAGNRVTDEQNGKLSYHAGLPPPPTSLSKSEPSLSRMPPLKNALRRTEQLLSPRLLTTLRAQVDANEHAAASAKSQADLSAAAELSARNERQSIEFEAANSTARLRGILAARVVELEKAKERLADSTKALHTESQLEIEKMASGHRAAFLGAHRMKQLRVEREKVLENDVTSAHYRVMAALNATKTWESTSLKEARIHAERLSFLERDAARSTRMWRRSYDIAELLTQEAKLTLVARTAESAGNPEQDFAPLDRQARELARTRRGYEAELTILRKEVTKAARTAALRSNSDSTNIFLVR